MAEPIDVPVVLPLQLPGVAPQENPPAAQQDAEPQLQPQAQPVEVRWFYAVFLKHLEISLATITADRREYRAFRYIILHFSDQPAGCLVLNRLIMGELSLSWF